MKQVAGLEKSLHTNLEQGIKDDPEEVEKRKAAYGANTYPKKKPKGILVCYGNCYWILLVTIHHFYQVLLITPEGKNSSKHTPCIGVPLLPAYFFGMVYLKYV